MSRSRTDWERAYDQPDSAPTEPWDRGPLLASCAYPAFAAAYDSSRAFRDRVHSYDGVQSPNSSNDPAIDDLMSAIVAGGGGVPRAWTALSPEQRAMCRQNSAVVDLIRSAKGGDGLELPALGLVLGDGFDHNDFNSLWTFSSALGVGDEDSARGAAKDLTARARLFATRHSVGLDALLRRARKPASFAARRTLVEVLSLVGQ